MALSQMKEEWSCVFQVNGKLCVIILGAAVKQEWCVDSLDIPMKVIVTVSYTSAAV